MLNGWKTAKRLLKEVNRLKLECTRLSSENYKLSNSKVTRGDYNNLLHENAVLDSRRIEYFEKIEQLRKDIEDNTSLIIEQHLKILELTNK